VGEPYLKYIEKLYTPGTTACQGCGMVLAFRHAVEALGRNTVVIHAPGCMGWVSNMPGRTAHKLPAIMPCFASSAAFASGLVRAYEILGRRNVNVFVLAGDGGTADIGLQALSGAAERKDPIIYVCYDNEAYMNTGIQQSGSTPYGAWTTTTPVGRLWKGKERERKDVPLIMLAHKIPYLATASVAYVEDYVKKVRKAARISTIERKGLSYIHIHSPCPPGWRIPSEKSIEVARLAVETGFWPLYEVVEGSFKFTVKPEKLKPIADYLKTQGRFNHLTDQQIAIIQESVNSKLAELERLALAISRSTG